MSTVGNRKEQIDIIYEYDIHFPFNDLDVAKNELKHQFEGRERYAQGALKSAKGRIEMIIEKLSKLY